MALLHDAARAGVLVVALYEPVVRLQAAHLIKRVRALDDHVPALIWNRVHAAPVPLPADRAVRQFVAAAVAPSPVGAERLLDWFDGWSALELDG
jgi:hypothetical protein